MTTVSGGGIFVAGGAALTLGGLTEGTGRVNVDGNLIQGNLAGAGDGGGIKVLRTLPADRIVISSNFIVDNVAGLAGGGIALQDAANVAIVHNTVARNDSTATAGAAFLVANESTPQPAGIASRGHSAEFQALTGATFSNPQLQGNIIVENRSFHFVIDALNSTIFGLVPDPTNPTFWDLGVLPPSAGALSSDREPHDRRPGTLRGALLQRTRPAGGRLPRDHDPGHAGVRRRRQLHRRALQAADRRRQRLPPELGARGRQPGA